MRLLFDQSFPRHVEDYSEIDFCLFRWTGEQVDDEELIEAAARDQLDGVVFLGLQPLADGRIADRADKLSIHLSATYDTEPMQALTAVTTHLAALRRAIRPGGLTQISKSGVRPYVRSRM